MRKIRSELNEQTSTVDLRNLEVITALASEYTSLFYVDLNNEEVFVYTMNPSVTSKYDAVFTTCNFEEAKKAYAERDIYPDDREEYYRILAVPYMREQLAKESFYSFVYRMIVGDVCEYCEVRIIRIMEGGNLKAAVVAYSNVDKRVKSAREHMEQLQAALHNAETDSLTGILNRGGGEIKVRRLISSGSCGMFVLFDVDSFKHINDRYGHKSGDIALQKIAAALKSSTRSGDLCIRFGGDEFVVLFDGVADSKEAEAIIERLFLRVSKISIDGMPDPLSISAGATIFPANEEDSFERIYSRVDEAMYKAKKTKGNFVVFC